MGTDFLTFLQKMDNETSPEKKSVKKNTIKPVQKIEKPIQETKPVQESKSVQKIENIEDLREEYAERGLNYASAFIKSIRKNFESKEERNIILESVRAAIDLYLGKSPSPVQVSNYSARIPKLNETKIPTGEAIDYKINDLTDREVNVQQPLNEENYSRSLDLKMTTLPNGSKTVDISGISQQEIDEIRVLAGITK